MSQLCFDRSSLIINVVFAARCSWSHCSSLCCTNVSWLWLLHLMGKALCSPPPTCLSLYYFSSFSLSFESSQRTRAVVSAHLYLYTHTYALTHTLIGLSGVSPEWLGYSGWHVSLIHYWSDPAAAIYRSLRDTALSLCHTLDKQTCLLANSPNFPSSQLIALRHNSQIGLAVIIPVLTLWLLYISSTKRKMDALPKRRARCLVNEENMFIIVAQSQHRPAPSLHLQPHIEWRVFTDRTDENIFRQ